MSASFDDHFAPVAAQYADARPGYPPALFDWLAAQCERHEFAWDCGAGSGQASIELASRFARVVASDASASQIAHARPHAGIDYRVAAAEHSGLPDQCADLVTVAQALHWFDLGRFYAEVDRVLRPGGVIAAFSYGVLQLGDEALDALVQRFYREQAAPWWPPQRRHIENGYRELAFPYERIAAPQFAMSARWQLGQLTGYIRSWSAMARFRDANGYDAVSRFEPQLRAQWGDAERRCTIRWPLALLAGRARAARRV